MTTKTITIMEDAYEILNRMKTEDESFSEVIRKLAKHRRGSKEAVLECAGLLNDVITDKDAEEIKNNITKYRKSDLKRLLEKVGNL